VFLAFLWTSFLSYLDLLMVKHFFAREQAGFYAITSIIGKAFLFFPMAITTALFPKVADHVELNRNPEKMLYKSLALTAVVSFAGIIFCFIFPEFVLRLLTGGDKYFAVKDVVRLFGLAILPLVLMNVVMNYSLASKKYNFIYMVFGGIALYAVLLWFFHSTFFIVLAVLFGVNALVLALSMLSLKFEKKAGAAQ
jgi:O-antigen/teichoic acid export membrane protein